MPELEEEAKGNDAPRWMNPPILSAWMGDRGVGYSPKYQLVPRNKMTEMTEAQKKRYEEVREWLARKLAEWDGFDWKAPTIKGRAHYLNVPKGEYYRRVDQILASPPIAILDSDEDLPACADFGYGLVVAAFAQKSYGKQMLQSNFRRVLPKGEPKP